jgi:hypothetical protein
MGERAVEQLGIGEAVAEPRLELPAIAWRSPHR